MTMQLLLTRAKISGEHGAERRGRWGRGWGGGGVIAVEGRDDHDCRNKFVV